MSRSSPMPETGPDRNVLSVSQLNDQIRESLQSAFPSVWVSGEVTDLACPASGHVYLGLKDDQGQIRGIVWRNTARHLPFDLSDGMEVICEGQVDVYPPRGTYQLIIRQIEPRGVGALQLALIQLRDRLAAEGLFELSHKRPIPKFPRRIAVVTSPTGAAVRDFLEVIKRRWRGCQVVVVPTRVQGSEAAGEIVQAIKVSQRMEPPPDLLVITRGGGSLEDLWCFNDEAVVREIFAAQVPTVTAIGHEIDVTLSDLVSDVRALTPTEAGERIVPSQVEVEAQLTGMKQRMIGLLRQRIRTAQARLESFANRPVLAQPRQRIQDLARRTDELGERMNQLVRRRVTESKDRLQHVASHLGAVSPLAVLGRGFSLTQRTHDGLIVRRASDVDRGDQITTRLFEGSITSHVTETASAQGQSEDE